MSDSLHGDLLGGRDDGRRGRAGGARGGWTHRVTSRAAHQGVPRLSGTGRAMPRSGTIREGTSFAQAVSSPCDLVKTKEMQETADRGSEDYEEGWQEVKTRKHRQSSSPVGQCDPHSPPAGFLPVAGSKRPRSPPSCHHCLRNTHKTSECRHRLSCKRCGGAGHLAVNCRVELPALPKHRRAHPKAKGFSSSASHSGEENQLTAIETFKSKLQKSHVSIPLTQESSKLRKDLAKIIVLDVFSGQTSEAILLEFLPGALNTPRVDAVYDFKGNSYLTALSSEEEALKASKIGDVSLPSKMGPCVFSIKPWSVDLGSVGSATGKAQVLLIWNLPLHAWTWSVLVDILRPIGELVAIPHPNKSHKSFVSVLVRCRPRVVLPHEIILSFGMRRFIVLVTDNHFPFPTFRKDLDKYVTSTPVPEDHPVSLPPDGDRVISRRDKGKEIMQEEVVLANKKNFHGRDAHQLSKIWRPRPQTNQTRPASLAPGVHSNTPKSARPESSAPGAQDDIIVARPESVAPGADGDRRTDTTVRVTMTSITDGQELLNNSNNHQLLPESSHSLHELQHRSGVVEQRLDNVDVVPGNTSGAKVTAAVRILARGKHLADPWVDKPLTSRDFLRPNPSVLGHDSRGTGLVTQESSEPSSLAFRALSDHIEEHTGGPELPGPTVSLEPTVGPQDCLLSQPIRDDHLEDTENFCNPDHPPSELQPPPNFKWVFLHGFWTLVPTKFSKEISSRSLMNEVVSLQQGNEHFSEDVLVEDTPQEPVAQNSEGSGINEESSDSKELEDSESDFEEKIRRMLQTGQTEDLSHCTRRSERRKKPSSRWNEEAGFVPQPPRSNKKKGTVSTTPEAPEPKKTKLEDPVSKIRRSLEFLTSGDQELEAPISRPPPSGEL